MVIKYKILLWLLLVYVILLLIQVDPTEAKEKRHKRLSKNIYECEWQICQRKTTKKCHRIRHCVKKGLQSSDTKGFDSLRDQNGKTDQVAPVTPVSLKTVHQLKKKQLQSICIRIVHDKYKHHRFNKKCRKGRNGQANGRNENTTRNGIKLNDAAKSMVKYATSNRPRTFTPSTNEISYPHLGGENEELTRQQASGRRQKNADLSLVNGKGVIKSGEDLVSAISTGSSIVTQSTSEILHPYVVAEEETDLEEREESNPENTQLNLTNWILVITLTSTAILIVPILCFIGYRRFRGKKQCSLTTRCSKILKITENTEPSSQHDKEFDGRSTEIETISSIQDTSATHKDLLVHYRSVIERNHLTGKGFTPGVVLQNNHDLDLDFRPSKNDHTQTDQIFRNSLWSTIESSPTESDRNSVLLFSCSLSSLESYTCLPEPERNCNISVPSLTSFGSYTWPRIGVPIDIFKSVSTSDVNITEFLQRDEGTQTKHTNQATTIFNTQFHGSASFNQQGGELQLPGSSVRLLVPPETVKESESVNILGHVHSDLRQLKNGLQLEENENIYSPAPEYHMDANWKKVIKKHMVIIIPHALQPGFHKSQLKVYRFSATGGTITKSAIPEKLKENEELAESYYEIETNVVRIFTLHFSGYVVCYNCRKEISCPRLLNVDILGSNQIINGRREVRIQYLVWDMKGNIPDLRNSWITVNKSQFHKLESKSVTLELYDDIEKVILTFTLTMTGEEANQWKTLTTESGDMEPFPLKTEVPLKKLMVCCREVPYVIEWVMISKPDHLPREQFQGVITMSDTIGHLDEATANQYPASYIQNVPQNLPERSMDIMDVLKRQLDNAQVEELCSKCQFPPETLAQLKTDKREMTAMDFNEKWIDRLYRRNDFQRDLESHLTSVKAWQVLSTLDEVEYFNNTPPPWYKFDSSGPEAMAEPSGWYLRRLSPVENSDHEDNLQCCFADEDETQVKFLETEV